ncbi:hypothetical protein KC963_00100 [Candidatus Saccharibacteria bacterium]|nr:hypothetical protein [Candidatus Saccharibacteria bacterium]
MADNVTANAGSGGATFATDEDGSTVHWPWVKLVWGGDDVFNKVSTSARLPTQALLQDSGGTALTSTLVGADQSLDVNVTQSVLPSDAASATNQSTIIGHVDGIETLLGTIDADISILAAAVSAGNVQVEITNTPTVDTELTTADLDTGAGTDTRAVVGLVGSASGGGELIPGSATDGLLVNLGSNNDVTVTGTVTANAGTGPWPVTDNGGSLTVDGTVTANLSATDNAVLDAIQTSVELLDNSVGVDGSPNPAGGLVVMGTDGTNAQTFVTDAAGQQFVVNAGTFATQAAQSGTWNITNISGTVSLPTGASTAANQATISSTLTTVETNTSGNTSHYRNVDANAEAEIKGSAGTLKWLIAMNMTAAVAYLHLYDNTAASVTPGTTTPTYTFPIPTAGSTNGAGFVLPAQIEFSTGITLVVTTTIDGSTGDPGTNGVFVNAGYV